LRHAACEKWRLHWLDFGFSKDDIIVAHPDHLDRAIGPRTEIVGITHDDPMGKIAVRELEEIIGRGPPHNRSKFIALLNHPLIREHRPKVVVGGNGAWELIDEDVGVDHIYLGEGESEFPKVCSQILAGDPVPRVIRGGAVPADRIPINRGATIAGIVGGWQRVLEGMRLLLAYDAHQFATGRWRAYLDDVLVNLLNGQKDIILHSEDVLTYGSRGIEASEEKVHELMKAVSSSGRIP